MSACGSTAPVEPAPVYDTQTGAVIPDGDDAGGTTFIRSEFPGEEKMKEFIACQMSAIYGNISAQDMSVTFNETGTTKPAKVYSCGSGDPASGILVSASMLAGAPAETTILGVAIVVGVGIYAIVSAAAYFDANNINFSMMPAAAYTPAPLPTFASFNSGTATTYSSYTTADFTFNTFGELASTVETVYMYDTAPTNESFLLGVVSVGQQVLYVTTTDQGRASYWTLPVAEWYELCQYARMAATAEAGAATLPPIVWPKWDPENPGWKHAAEHRKWPILGIMLAYEAIMHTADHIYFSPSRMKVLITTWDPYIGIIGQIFTTSTVPIIGELVPGGQLSVTEIKPESPITIIMDGVKMTKLRYSGCYSVQVYPFPSIWEPQYEPPMIGQGRCLENGN